MPRGKPADVACVNLDPESFACRVWGSEEYPNVCRDFSPSREDCGTSREQALANFTLLEKETGPDP